MYVLLSLKSIAIGQQFFKEVAALYIPSITNKIPTETRRVINELVQEQVSIRFDLISETKVNSAFKQSLRDLKGEDCNEDNCISMMQEILKTQILFTFGVVLFKGEMLMAIRLQDGQRKYKKTKNCDEPCEIDTLKKQLSLLVDEVIFLRDQDKIKKAIPPGIYASSTEIDLYEGDSYETFSVKLLTPIQQDVELEIVDNSNNRLTVNPKILVFKKDDWNQDKYVYISATKDESFQGVKNYEVKILVRSSKDLSYGFGIKKKIMKIKVLEDSQTNQSMRAINEIEIMSNPSGARIKIDDKYLRDSDNVYLLTPNTISLNKGRRVIVIEKEGYFSRSLIRRVGMRPLGSVMFNLKPKESSLRIKIPAEYVDGHLFINDIDTKQSLSKNKKYSILPGDYTVQIKGEEFFSEKKAISIIPGEDAFLTFVSFSEIKNTPNLSGQIIGINHFTLGFHYDSLIVKPNNFPLDKVSWGIPGGTINLEQKISSIKMFGSYGSGNVTPFLQGTNSQNLNIDRVNVINSGIDYGFHWGLPIRLGAGLGWTRFSFSSDDGNLNYSYFSPYLGLSSKFSQENWFMEGHFRFNNMGQGGMQIGIGYIP